MAYRLSASFLHAALALIFVSAGAWAVLASVTARMGAAAGWLAVGALLGLCAHAWQRDVRRRPMAIRLMGPQRAILYYPSDRVRSLGRLARLARFGHLGAGPGGRGRHAGRHPNRHSLEGPRSDAAATSGPDLEAADCLAVRIEGATHWPGRLLSLRLSPLPVGLHGLPPAPGMAASVRKKRFSRNLLIWADTMPEGCYRSLCVQIRCGQRGVMFVEER